MNPPHPDTLYRLHTARLDAFYRDLRHTPPEQLPGRRWRTVLRTSRH